MSIPIFKCISNEYESISDEIVGRLGRSFEELNKDAGCLTELAIAQKDQNGSVYCLLPFDSTLEADALGAQVIYDNIVGNRIGRYALRTVDDLEALGEMDFASGRIGAVLQAVRLLKQHGEKVVLNVTGPVTLATSVLDNYEFYRAVRRSPDKISDFMLRIEDGIVRFIQEGIRYGADIISLADPSGAMDIVGPAFYEQVTAGSTVRILQRVKAETSGAIIHLCGKTSTSLEAAGLIRTETVPAPGESYLAMLESLKTAETQFIGHWCMKMEKHGKMVTLCYLDEKGLM